MATARAAMARAAPPVSRNAGVDFRGTRRSNVTHASLTDSDARLYRKSAGTGARLCCMGHMPMENRHGLVVDAETTRAAGFAERPTAVAMVADLARPEGGRIEGGRITPGADRAYDNRDFVSDLRNRCVTRTSHGTPAAGARRSTGAPPGTPATVSARASASG